LAASSVRRRPPCRGVAGWRGHQPASGCSVHRI
jgi:hypothetical protein